MHLLSLVMYLAVVHDQGGFVQVLLLPLHQLLYGLIFKEDAVNHLSTKRNELDVFYQSIVV